MLSWAVQQLRLQGLALVNYLDDIILWNHDPLILKEHIRRCCIYLQHLGFRIHSKKSHLSPASTLEWLGIRWFGLTGQWQVKDTIREKISQEAVRLATASAVTRRQWEAFIGLVNFACQVHTHLRPLLQPLTRSGLVAPAYDRDAPRRLPATLKDALTPWQQSSVWKVIPYFRAPYKQQFLWTDASTAGWGALLESRSTTSGQWSPLETSLHINILEMRAVRMALVNFNLSHTTVLLLTDSEVVRHVLRNFRARSSELLKEYQMLVQHCLDHDVYLQVSRVPSKQNVVADGLSREEPLATEWRLPREAFLKILRWAGNLEVDLMATSVNTQLPSFVSPFTHPRALATNALAID